MGSGAFTGVGAFGAAAWDGRRGVEGRLTAWSSVGATRASAWVGDLPPACRTPLPGVLAIIATALEKSRPWGWATKGVGAGAIIGADIGVATAVTFCVAVIVEHPANESATQTTLMMWKVDLCMMPLRLAPVKGNHG